MPIINKRVMGGPVSEEEKNAMIIENNNPGTLNSIYNTRQPDEPRERIQ